MVAPGLACRGSARGGTPLSSRALRVDLACGANPERAEWGWLVVEREGWPTHGYSELESSFALRSPGAHNEAILHLNFSLQWKHKCLLLKQTWPTPAISGNHFYMWLT